MAIVHRLGPVQIGGREIISDLPTQGDGRANPYNHPWIRGFAWSADERDQVLAFLEALTDDTFLGDPELQNPWPMP